MRQSYKTRSTAPAMNVVVELLAEAVGQVSEPTQGQILGLVTGGDIGDVGIAFAANLLRAGALGRL